MREIVMDTETTGLSTEDGHRLIDIGCVELENMEMTGNHGQWYVDPQRSIPAEAVAIHGMDDAFFVGRPLFADIVDAFIDFIGDSRLIIHNAPFDLGFLNMELTAVGRPPLSRERVLDTLPLARKKYPQASLDALCQRFSISLDNRRKHGALTDSRLLAQVYPYLMGRKIQRGFDLVAQRSGDDTKYDYGSRCPPSHDANDAEKKAHRRMVETIPGSLWLRLSDGEKSG